jgi:hypothetical protein
LREFAVIGTALILAAIVAVSTGAAASSGTSLAPGDQLIYQITVELQQHHTTAGAHPQDKAVESSAQGTETFTIYAIGSDGTAFANVDASFQGTDRGTPFESHSTTAAKVMPDGRLLVKNQLGLGISDALTFANTTTAEITEHELHLGGAWTTPENTPSVHLTLSRTVVGQKIYQGFTAYEVQTLGSGELLKTNDGMPASGSVSVSGTSYYDAVDHLLIGEALRTLTVVQQPGSKGGHDNYSATMDVVLSSWTHASPAPAAQSSPEESPESTPAAEASTPVPIPSIFGPTPYPTVTPRL